MNQLFDKLSWSSDPSAFSYIWYCHILFVLQRILFCFYFRWSNFLGHLFDYNLQMTLMSSISPTVTATITCALLIHLHFLALFYARYLYHYHGISALYFFKYPYICHWAIRFLPLITVISNNPLILWWISFCFNRL